MNTTTHPPNNPLPTQAIDEALWRGEMTAELRHIHLTICDVQRQVHELRCFVAEQLNDHRMYHARNEVKWGPVRWCERHPFQLCVLVLGAGAAISLCRAGVEWIQVATMLWQITK